MKVNALPADFTISKSSPTRHNDKECQLRLPTNRAFGLVFWRAVSLLLSLLYVKPYCSKIVNFPRWQSAPRPNISQHHSSANRYPANLPREDNVLLKDRRTYLIRCPTPKPIFNNWITPSISIFPESSVSKLYYSKIVNLPRWQSIS